MVLLEPIAGESDSEADSDSEEDSEAESPAPATLPALPPSSARRPLEYVPDRQDAASHGYLTALAKVRALTPHHFSRAEKRFSGGALWQPPPTAVLPLSPRFRPKSPRHRAVAAPPPPPKVEIAVPRSPRAPPVVDPRSLASRYLGSPRRDQPGDGAPPPLLVGTNSPKKSGGPAGKKSGGRSGLAR